MVERESGAWIKTWCHRSTVKTGFSQLPWRYYFSISKASKWSPLCHSVSGWMIQCLRIFCIHVLQKHLPYRELLLLALWQRHLYLSALCGSRKRKNIQVLSNNCGVCSEKHLSCRKKGTNKTHELHTSSFK